MSDWEEFCKWNDEIEDDYAAGRIDESEYQEQKRLIQEAMYGEGDDEL